MLIGLLLLEGVIALVAIAVFLPDVYSYSLRDGDFAYRCFEDSHAQVRILVRPVTGAALAFAAFAIGAPRPRRGSSRFLLALFPAAAILVALVWVEFVKTTSDYCSS